MATQIEELAAQYRTSAKAFKEAPLGSLESTVHLQNEVEIIELARKTGDFSSFLKIIN